ncbi:MAG: T9SS type A sorting domain-containing protein [Candidatus Fermentibacter sp.]|nr:T9SS type A sorting domain-containing protein [Candidatus Fermentibacter sp.]
MIKSGALAMLVLSVAGAGTGRFSDFAWFFDSLPTNGFFCDGFVSDGPFRANCPVSIWSDSPGRDGDPWFYSLTLASPFYYCSPGGGTNPQTSPQCGDLWIEPYEQMSQGAPWFVLDAEPLDFGIDCVNWQEMRSAAITGGIFLTSSSAPNGTRILVGGDFVLVRKSQASPVQEFDLTGLGEPVIWIENEGTDRVYFKSCPGDSLTVPLSIGMYGSIYTMGPLRASQGAEGGVLGLMSLQGDFVIALDPDLVGSSDWADPVWRIETEDDFEFDASVICLGGELLAEHCGYPDPPADLVIAGSMQLESEGITSIFTAGWNVSVEYDWRLADTAPPCYPEYSETGIGGWEEGISGYAALSARPDPFSSSLEVRLDGSEGPVRLCVFDMSGRLLIDTVSGDGLFDIDGEGLPAGVLLLRASSSAGTATARVVRIG